MSAAHDLVVIGGGTAGLSAAQAAVAMQRRVLMVSEGPLGGECTWNGCVPSKALIEAARRAHEARQSPRFGIDTGSVRVDFAAVMERVHRVVTDIARFEDEEHLRATGVEVRRGRARLQPGGGVEVDGEHLDASRVVVATGSRPAMPPIPGLDATPHLTNETLFDLRVQPRRLLVLGAGPIGLEMAQAFARLGSEVEVVDMAAAHLPREDPDIAAVSRRLLEAEGVRFTYGATVMRAATEATGVRLDIEVGGEGRSVVADALLVATGRRPNVDGLGLEDAGVAVERRGVTVDGHLRTSAANVWAAGDVTGILPFTHVAAYQGRLAARNALGKRSSASYRVVPWVVFTEPEIAHVGLTEPEAREQHGDAVHVVSLPFTAVDRAVIGGSPQGLIKVITRRQPLIGHAAGGSILGAHLIGPGAGELIHEFVIAMQVHAFGGRLAQAIHAYPSMSMGVQQAVAQLFAAGRATAGAMREELGDRT